MTLKVFNIAKACQVVVEKVIKESGQPVCLAAVDSNGALLYFYRMDDTPERINKIAISKAYTSARMGVTTAKFRQRLLSEHLSLLDFMDRKLTSLPGGIPIFNEHEELVGGIGVSGRDLDSDVLLCQQFAKRIQISL